MRKLFEFIVAKRHWILFIFCEIISFVLIYHNNAYQRNMMLSSANVVTGRILSISGTVSSYFDLQKVNHQLLERNSLLEMELLRLKAKADKAALDSVSFDKTILTDTVLAESLFFGNYDYKYIPVGVVNNSTTNVNNYITINKGYNDGIHPDMGVVSPQGIVGIVATVEEHFSVVISLLSSKFKVSCKVINTNYTGSLSWKGGSVKYAYLDQLPTHATFQIGDTIVTSGNSAIFPPGVMVGIVESYNREGNDNFYSLKVLLNNDFHSLNVLSVIDNSLQKEQRAIEMEARKND